MRSTQPRHRQIVGGPRGMPALAMRHEFEAQIAFLRHRHERHRRQHAGERLVHDGAAFIQHPGEMHAAPGQRLGHRRRCPCAPPTSSSCPAAIIMVRSGVKPCGGQPLGTLPES